MLDILHQTRHTVLSGYPNTDDKILGICIADEILSGVFDISSQSKQKLRNRRDNIVKIYANLRPAGYPNFFHCYDFLFLV